jgi:tRNA 2-thiouridine synthesizing protein A
MLALNEGEKKEINEVHKLDIRGKICPMTFVYTKLELEKMHKGQLLEVILDFPAAIKNVPNSCKRQNLGELIEVKEADKEKKEWILKIKKL